MLVMGPMPHLWSGYVVILEHLQHHIGHAATPMPLSCKGCVVIRMPLECLEREQSLTALLLSPLHYRIAVFSLLLRTITSPQGVSNTPTHCQEHLPCKIGTTQCMKVPRRIQEKIGRAYQPVLSFKPALDGRFLRSHALDEQALRSCHRCIVR